VTLVLLFFCGPHCNRMLTKHCCCHHCHGGLDPDRRRKAAQAAAQRRGEGVPSKPRSYGVETS